MSDLIRDLTALKVPIHLVMGVLDLQNALEHTSQCLKDYEVSEDSGRTKPSRVFVEAVNNEQTKLESRIEIAANYISGFAIAYFSWLVLSHGPMTWGWFDIYDSFLITSIFTVISMTRSYAWRRFFAVGLHRVVHSFVAEWRSK